ncbi:Hsp20/alpha crystallin family protein [Streptomyces sp. NPDC050504]|uniref:Hsp20/alpha crystallin family protein n=1 Tax=Streptomyces sp. NPDC050504 TaxID=3365618 RepID=UPI0037ABEC42
MGNLLEWRPSMLPDLIDWMESGFGVHPAVRSPSGPHGVRIEEHLDDSAYTLRAELPGLDPEKDIELTCTGDLLTLRAERREQTESRHRTEFRYGVLARTVRLPAGTRWDEATATYQDGVLAVTVPVTRNEETTRTIPVTRPA